MKTCTPLASILSACALVTFCSQANAATLIDYDFDTNVASWSSYSSRNSYTLMTDTNDIFGQGTNNKFARFQDANSSQTYTASTGITVGSSPLTMTYDLYKVSQSEASGCFGFGSGSLTDNGNNANRVASMGFANLAVGTLYSVTCYYNNTAADLAFYNPVSGTVENLAAQEGIAFAYDIAGSLWQSLNFTGGSSGNITRILYYDANTGLSTVYMDNLKVVDEITAVPEPSTYALLGAAGIAGMIVLRRRKR